MRSLALASVTALWVGTSLAAVAGVHESRADAGTSSPGSSRLGTIRGRIFGADGRPFANALVFVHSARPADGPPLQCPTCYLECGSTARTASDGSFQLGRMSEDLRFTLLVFADGHVPDWVYGLAPGTAPFADTLQARKSGRASAVTFRGRVVDRAGVPVAGAVITPRGVRRADSARFGPLDFVDPVAVTDSAGRFDLPSDEDWPGLVAEVRARTKAPAVFSGVSPDSVTELVLDDGATVSGRVARDGRPASGIALGLVQLDRNAESFVSQDTIGTNAQGEFLFTNVPSSQDYALFALSETTAPLAVQTALVTVGEPGSVRRVPDLDLVPGHTLRGKVVVRGSRKLPAGVQLTVFRSLSKDALRVRVGPDGTFVVQGLPTESLRLRCSASGYRVGESSTGFVGDLMRSLRVAVTKDTDVVIWLEPFPASGF